MTRWLLVFAGVAAGVWLLCAVSMGFVDHSIASVQIAGTR